MSVSEERGKKRSPKRTSSTDLEINDDDLYDALSNSRRRHIIRTLATKDEVTLGDVALQIAAAENDCSPAQVDSQERKRVRIGLHQVHARRLDEWGVIDWNKPRQILTRGPVHEVAYRAMCAVSEPLDEPDSILDRVKNLVSEVSA